MMPQTLAIAAFAGNIVRGCAGVAEAGTLRRQLG